MPDINGIPYVESSDLVSAYPAVSQSLAQEVSDQLASKLDLAGGKILQVISGTTSTPVSSNTNVFVDTGLSATITPSSATSTILVMVSQNGNYKTTNSTGAQIILLRDSTQISELSEYAGFNAGTAAIDIGSVSTMFLDSPATATAITYKTQFRSRLNLTQVSVQANSETSTIVLMEVSA